MIIATAGHVDHGKTSLIRALTGIDTDSLPEEKKRGLSIDLGFAHCAFDKDETIGFVDVPGHSRFIKNAICGLVATRAVLLVIAADDGIMPQTREHLAIIDLLGTGSVIPVMTKVDRVDVARVNEIEAQIIEMLNSTWRSTAPLFHVSNLTRQGIDALRAYLKLLARQSQNESRQDYLSENFRFAVDRAFEIKGAGLIVTGSIFSGAIAVNQGVTIAETGVRARVRNIETHHGPSQGCHAGQRCALNLAAAGLNKKQIRRGQWVVADFAPLPVDRFDARISYLPHNLRPLRHWTPVHIHLGAAQTTARIALLDTPSVSPGAQALVQIVTAKPIGAAHADRLIIRDQSARATVAGGRVLDIFPPQRGRASKSRIEWLETQDNRNSVAALGKLLDQSQVGVNLQQFCTNRNLTQDRSQQLRASAEIVEIGAGASKVGFSLRIWKQHCERLYQVFENQRSTTGAANKVSRADLKKSLDLYLRAEIFTAMIEKWMDDALIHCDSDGYQLSAQHPESDIAADPDWILVSEHLTLNDIKPVRIVEIEQQTRLPRKQIKRLLKLACDAGLAARLSADLFISPGALMKIKKIIEVLIEQNDNGVFQVSDFRNASDIGRNRCIEILEIFDAYRITLREQQGRRLLNQSGAGFDRLLKRA